MKTFKTAYSGESCVKYPSGLGPEVYYAKVLPREVTALIAGVCKELGIPVPRVTVSRRRTVRRLGTYQPGNRKIIIYRLEKCIVLHELAHYIAEMLFRFYTHGPIFGSVLSELWAYVEHKANNLKLIRERKGGTR